MKSISIVCIFSLVFTACIKTRPQAHLPRTKIIPAMGMGPYKVASSHFGLNQSKLDHIIKVKKRNVKLYAIGIKNKKEGKVYITDLFPENPEILNFSLNIPHDKDLYGVDAGTELPYACFTLFPTTDNNDDPDYQIGSQYPDKLPHMVKRGENPQFSPQQEKYPLIIFSHGWAADPVVHLPELIQLASHGYVVLTVFHGEGRLDSRKSQPQRVSLRPLSLKYAIEMLRKDKRYTQYIDWDKIGAWGVSNGGRSIYSLLGGKMWGHYSPGVPEIKAAFTHWPVMSDAWGRNYSGVKEVSTPYLGVSGDADTEGTLLENKTLLEHSPGVKYLISLKGEKHHVIPGAQKDAMTWSILFLDAYLRNNTNSLYLLDTLLSVEGGPEDRVVPLK